MSAFRFHTRLLRLFLLLRGRDGLATFVAMHPITIDLSPEIYKQLEEQARKRGQGVEVLSRELLETVLTSHEHEAARPRPACEALQAAGRIRPLSDALRRKIIPGVTLDEVRAILSQAGGLPLSDLIQKQRGSKS